MVSWLFDCDGLYYWCVCDFCFPFLCIVGGGAGGVGCCLVRLLVFCDLTLLGVLVICCVWFRFVWIGLFSVDWLLLCAGCIRLWFCRCGLFGWFI